MLFYFSVDIQHIDCSLQTDVCLKSQSFTFSNNAFIYVQKIGFKGYVL